MRVFLHAVVSVAAVIAVTPYTAVGRVQLAGGKARLFKGGQPLVFGGAVGRVEGKPPAGGVVDVVDGAENLIGWGVWNPHSMYRVRLLATHETELLQHRDVESLVKHRLTAAAERRAACCLPSETNTAYRLVNSEGDRISGLTVDVFGRTAVAVSSALWLEIRRDAVMDALRSLPDVDEVVWRRSDSRLKQDGWVSDEAAPVEPALEEPQPIVVFENGLRFLVSPTDGQKSGFYCDQRDNRRLLADVCAGKRVLDLYCYSGGFSLNAAAAGAALCLGVDSSALAVSMAQRNAELNNLDGTCSYTRSEVAAFLKGEGVAGEWDVVICDPPKLAPTVKDLTRATRKYRQLNGLAMRAVRRGGLLLSCSCSAAMTQSGGFTKMLQEAAAAEGRSITILRTTGAASDHVIHPACPESNYLTATLLHVE